MLKTYKSFIYPSVQKIYVIGDIHGDIDSLLDILINKIKVINEKKQWIGGKTVIIQMGDQVDGCKNDCFYSNDTDDISVLKFMTHLHILAHKHGGAVHSLLGNHEIMNVQQNFNYVPKQSKNKILLYEGIQGDKKYISRKNAFKQGGILASFMAQTRTSALIVGSWIFIHGGIHHENADFQEINKQVYQWLMNKTQNNYEIHKILNDPNLSIFWNRSLSKIKNNLSEDDEQCIEHLSPILKIYPKKKIVVGHTIQPNGITSTCNDKIFRVDTGISDGINMTKKKKMILLITNDKNIEYISV